LALGLATLGVAACVEEMPTTVDEGLLPTEPVTIEVELPWSDFGSNLEVFGGYGAPRQIGSGIIANGFGTVTARTLARFVPYPIEVVVQDSLGTTRVDQEITFVGGRVNVRFDTLASTNGRTPVTVSVSSVQNEWDPASVNWINGVDSLGDQQPWPQPGAEPVRLLSTADWDPLMGDSVLIDLDSAAVADMADSSDPTRGVRIDLVTAGERLEINNVQLWLEILPTANPDTIVVDTLPLQDLTFVYDPAPLPPVGAARIGGVPAWRTVLDVDLPLQFTGPPELCAAVGCPLVIEPEQVSYAALVLQSAEVDPGFAPTGSLSLDVRTVFSRSSLPKSPLGPSLIGGFDVLVDPDIFGPAQTAPVELPITAFIRELLSESEPGALPVSNTLAMLATFEPVSFPYMSFFGPGVPEEPVLRLILTIGPAVQLP
jgi:hypothetical protein